MFAWMLRRLLRPFGVSAPSMAQPIVIAIPPRTRTVAIGMRDRTTGKIPARARTIALEQRERTVKIPHRDRTEPMGRR